jgi:hypothetical protein
MGRMIRAGAYDAYAQIAPATSMMMFAVTTSDVFTSSGVAEAATPRMVAMPPPATWRWKNGIHLRDMQGRGPTLPPGWLCFA